MHIEHCIVIGRPVDEVFAFVTNLDNERRWQPEIESIRLLTPAPFRVGSEFEEVRRSLGRQFHWRFRVTALEPARTFAIASIGGAPVYQGSRRFEPVPAGTRLTETGDLETRGALRLLDPLLTWLALRSQRRAFARLKALIEGASPAQGG
jgi:uncharacterized membrane protein